MPAIPSIPDHVLEALAKSLGECATGAEITRILGQQGLSDSSGESTKWRRLHAVFLSVQAGDRCANRVLVVVEAIMSPVRFVDDQTGFLMRLAEVNKVLAFAGASVGEDGKVRPVENAATITEAEKRARTLRSKLQGRSIHPEALKYCRSELLQDNYFHAVFEATKGLAQRIRDISGVQADGSALIDRVFPVDRPLIAFNTMTTETERSDHKGLAQLLKGCFSAIRNRLAHEPKLLWDGEEDAADFLTLVSLLHRKLDKAVPTGLHPNSPNAAPSTANPDPP